MISKTDEEKQVAWLDALYQHGLGESAIQEALSADELWEETQRIRPETGRATVYRFVDKLIRMGLLQQVHGYRNCNTYIPAVSHHQTLFICMDCGKVSQVDCDSDLLAALEATRKKLNAHNIKNCHLQLLDTYITCQSDQP